MGTEQIVCQSSPYVVSQRMVGAIYYSMRDTRSITEEKATLETFYREWT